MGKGTGVPETELPKNLQRAELSSCDNAGSFLQSGFWGSFKARFGWEALAFRALWKSSVFTNEDEKLQAEEKTLLVLRRTLMPGFSLAYVPWGPELPFDFPDEKRGDFLRELASSLKGMLPKDTAFIRFDLPWLINDKFRALPPPFIRSGTNIQAPDTVIVDISQTPESIKGQMKPKWRYNANLAQKKGVSVSRAGGEKINVFYDLLKETALRDGIAIHGFDYYRALFESGWYAGKKPDIRLYLAEHERDVLAGIVTLFWGQTAVYLYGASSDKKRNLMATYALQLKAMEDAKASGCLEYDLFGIPPSEGISHPMAGLYRFKTGFGGKIIRRYGCWDYLYHPPVYRAFHAAEKLRASLKKLRKKSSCRNENKEN